MNIRNFCIIAHIDHGKSTLADRLLEFTQTISHREMRDQLLDQMDIERERGITIKLQPARMKTTYRGSEYILNLIDTPGHVDFTYEVSRSLAAVEGALLLVDATQGIQAQTLANLYLALEQNLTLIPVLNKIDLPGARISEVTQEIVQLLGCSKDEVLTVSAKTGEGIKNLVETLIDRIPPPRQTISNISRALIFDSIYHPYRGVVAYVRVFDGILKKEDLLFFKAAQARGTALELGVLKPQYEECGSLQAGEIGYLVTGLKAVHECRVGDTITLFQDAQKIEALSGYKEVKPMVFAGMFCRSGDEFHKLRDAIEKLKLNDAALSYVPENSPALGFGFRCGFLGLLHLEIIQERIRREFGLEVIMTVPSVEYHLLLKNSQTLIIHSPLELPDSHMIESIQEPWVAADIITPESTIGAVMSYAMQKRGVYSNTEYLGVESAQTQKRVLLHYTMPLASLLVDFYDTLKSISSGYASLNYELKGYNDARVVRMDINVGGRKIEELSTIVYEDEAYFAGRKIVESLKKSLDRQQFEIKIQASIGSNIIASERIAPFRKDVTAKLYGGDVTRKQKLLEKQKKGKKKMKERGNIDIPPEAYLRVLRRSSS